jgi:HK97 gp10 family phage protein
MIESNLNIRGLDDIKQKLAEIPRALRRSVLKKALIAGARIVRDEARRNAPILKSPRVNRKRGTLRKSIVVRTSKLDTRDGNVGVFVNVRPAKGAIFKNGVLVKGSQRGKDSPNDPYYWPWLEFGRNPKTLYKISNKTKRTRKYVIASIPPWEFLKKGARKLNESLAEFENNLEKWFKSVDQNGNIES